MFAVIRTGGKQYRVAKDNKIEIEKIDAKAGETVTFEKDDVLFADGGKKATVIAKVIEQIRGDKVVIFKKKRRQNYRRRKGHRQELTLIQITDVKAA
ncbi:50S ribosomal protein L21 [Micavibrio aeruginosavorus]|jgi:large subunit ribosomal protein L21|uniref:Large ribosomal subunit protein bL21 n=2 Tax=Micavibrio aeruginosavorus TaxID=349221 RepID=G2KRH4_MICAA|nr:50S ribosomal protein L21 [Micavibrio aeruginosavorus]AEP09536.1 ribosomal protein L21 [Micavibrio aeruginosavorus ARL-13]AGH97981.1 LSU ribosomal protein L21p [Micavibrio aeruginosavorus EPB]